MKRPKFEKEQQPQQKSILLIDKEGMLSAALLKSFPADASYVYVGKRTPEQTRGTMHYVHFGNLMPQIPDVYYSHIIVVYTGEKDILSLIPQFLDKARKDNAAIYFILDLFFADPAFVQELTYSYRNAHAIITGDLFGKEIPFDESKTINRFFEEANTQGTLQVAGEGLTHTFPVLFADAVEAITQQVFSQNPHKMSYVFPKHPPTQLSLARMMQASNPFLRIDFADEKFHAAETLENSQKMLHITPTGTYLLPNNYPLLKKIKESGLLSEENVREKPVVKEHAVKTPPKVRKGPVGQKKSSFLSPTAMVSFVLLLIFLPFFITIFFAGFGIGGLLVTRQAIGQNDLATAQRSAEISQKLFSVAQATGGIVALEAKTVGLGYYGEMLQQQLAVGSEGSYALSNTISSIQTMLGIVTKASPTPQKDFVESSNKLKKAITIFQKFRAQKSLPFGLQEFSQLDSMVSLVAATIDSYPTLLGMDEKKTYLILFQNNAELRPGGGFIGSYGLLTMDKGSVTDFKIHDVYDADGQLTGHVEPAYPFRRHMGIVHQYMRDSNYSPDFPTAASVSANMFAMETGTSVSGVIGIDTSFVKTIVAALSPIYVADYNETVTADNFYMLTQSHAEKNFFPGSTQKKDFLRSLFHALQLKLTEQKSLPYMELAKAVATGIAEKHVLFAFPDPSIQQVFSANKLSASLVDTREKKQSQYNDFLAISETNIGANKANAFVLRKVEQKAQLEEDGRVKNMVTIRFKNESKDWPGGGYKTYLRIITPKGSLLSDITIDGQKQSITPAITDYLLYERPDFITPQGLEVETAQELEKTVFGFLVEVPKGAFKTITVTYVSSTVMNMGQQTISYNLWYFKQPGTDLYPYTFVFSYPKTYKAFRATHPLTMAGESVVFEKNITTDQYFHIDLSKK